MENLKNIKCSLVGLVQTQLGDLKHTDAKELGEVIDMIKDLEEAMYYCAIIEAMEESKKEKENSENSSFNNINYYMEPMYYQGGGQGSGSNGASMGSSGMGGARNYTPYMEYAPYMMRDDKWRDQRLYNTADKTYNSRRMYMESKQNQATDQQAMKELEHYIKDLGDDLTDMIRDSSTEEKQVLSQKLQQLATKVNK